jgi:hypothetical protein
MGAAHSKRRSSPEAYRRIFAGKLYRAPKGKRWTKPSVIVDALQILAATEEARAVAPLLDYAIECHNRLEIKPWKKGEERPTRMPSGNKGNVFLEYGWSQFTRHGKILGEQDIMSDHHCGKIDRWYDSLTPTARNKADKPKAKADKVKNPRAFKRHCKKAGYKAESEANKAKALGDKIRADAAAARQRQQVYVEECRAETSLLDSLKGMLPKEA